MFHFFPKKEYNITDSEKISQKGIEMTTHTRKKRMSRRRRKAILRRKRALVLGGMALVVILLLYLIVHALYIKFKPKADKTTLTLRENGQVRLEEVVDTDNLSVSKGELKKSIKEDINKFNKKHDEKLVRFIRIGSKDDKTYVETTYKDIDTYAKFSGYDVKLTTVKKSKCDFNAVFYRVKDSKKTKQVSDLDVKKMKYNLLTLDENIAVKVPGEIKVVSDEGTKVTADDEVLIKPTNGDTDYAVKTYIVFE